MEMDKAISKTSAPPRAGFAAVFKREIGIFAHSPFYLLFTMLLPLATFGLFLVIFHNEIPRDLPVVICDQDDSTLSRQITRMINATSALAVTASVDNPLKGAAMIRQNNAYALILVPRDTEKDVKRGMAPAIVAYYNNQWLLASGVIYRAVREAIGTLSAGLDIRSRMLRGADPAQALETYEPIRVDSHLLFNPNLNYRYLLLPGLLPTIIQAFILMVIVRAIGSELKHGTAGEWLDTAGGRPWAAVLGKVMPYTICFIILVVFMLVLLIRFANLPVYGNMPLVLGASVLFVLAYESMGLAFIVLAGNLRLANSLAGFYAGPAFAVVGITFPVAGMPFFARLWHNSLPLSHYMCIFLDQTLRGAPPQASSHALLALFLFTVIPPLLFVPRLARQMRNPACWGRI